MQSKDAVPDYSSVDYWNNRYKDEEHFEWLSQSYAQTLTLLEREIGLKTSKILILGCGNSRLSEDLYRMGFRNIVSTDISSVCIENQVALHGQSKPGLEWKVADMTNMKEFPDESFDVVLEKATIDSLLVNERSPWSVSEEAQSMVGSALGEISRVLSAEGRFFSISFSQPHFRVPLYSKKSYNWDIQHDVINRNDTFHFYCFVMTKGRNLNVKEDLVHRTILDMEETVVMSDSEDDGFIFKIGAV